MAGLYSSEFVVPIQFGEVPIIGSTEDLAAAARRLATSNCAYVVPKSITSPFGDVSDTRRKLVATTYALNQASTTWIAPLAYTRTVTPEEDLGVHGNGFDPDVQEIQTIFTTILHPMVSMNLSQPVRAPSIGLMARLTTT